MALTRAQREGELRKLERIDALELALNYFVEDETKREFVYFVMLEFVDEKKVKVDTKKVTIATKKIPFEAFVVLQKVVAMDPSVYAGQHETFTARLNSGHKQFKVPPIEAIVEPWAAACEARVADDAQFEAELAERTSKANSALSGKKMAAALKVALTDPPIKSKNLDLKGRSAELIYRVLKAVPAKSIEKQVAKLDAQQLDILMRYVYRGLSVPGNASSFLKWHAAIVAAGGLGTVGRVLCGPLV